MNRYIMFFSLSFAFLFTACSEKSSALKHFENNPKSAYLIQHTKKRDISYKNELKAMFFATYLNRSYKEYKNDKQNSFVIGLHLVNKHNHDLLENGYKLFINNVEVKEFKKLKKDSKLVKDIPLKNAWANYYLVNSKNNKKVYKLNLKLTHPTFGQLQLSFDK